LLEQLYQHRITHLDRFFASHNPTSSYPALPSKQEIRNHELGQLSLFPNGSPNTLIQWKKDKVDFVEFVVAIYESNSVKAITDQKLPKKDFYEAMSWFFNVRVGHWHGTLNAAKARKIEIGRASCRERV
jgi:hypothetical protein